LSEPELISPLLDGCAIGGPISEHHGVACYPAMDLNTQEKYIVKTVTIPASDKQLEALLLSGAFPNENAASAYFKELAEDIVLEAEILQRLARLEGFCAYDGWQITPPEDGTRYQVYLKNKYRPTLERFLSRNPMTHLGAVNLGLDLCSALSACRRSGYLYVDVKPGNIFICDDREYRLGDLGFVALSSLRYASLPDKYRSSYTAPEITDAYSSLNTTLDTYAVGLVLYQVYNNGQLPFEGSAPAEPLAPPPYADYEMAEIILKACAPDPQDRWEDPAQMGQALVSYLQRNRVNDTPIIPPSTPVEEPPVEEEAEAPQSPEAPVTEEEAPEAAESEESEPSETEPEDPEETVEQTDASVEAPVEAVPEEEEEDELAILDELLQDETAPDEENAQGLDDAPVSEEISQMLAQADELIAHELPEPVVAPEPIDVPVPPMITEETVETEATEESEAPAEAPEASDAGGVAVETAEESPEEVSPPEEDAEEETEEETEVLPAKPKKKHTGLIVTLILLLVLVLAGLGGYVYYNEYYLQSIAGITLQSTENRLTVRLDTEADNSLLTVYCTDSYGNVKHSAVENNTAHFDNLRPDTNYKITVKIEGFHELVGVTTGTHTTAAQTHITGFTAVTGAEDGSVILNFTVQGPESSAWRVRYSAPGVKEKTLDFTGHMVTITGLKIGKLYTFQLEPATTLYLEGTTTLEYTATKIIYAEELTTLGFQSGTLTATWKAPDGVTVNSWTVRCYNDAGYDQTVTVTEPTAAFQGLDPAPAYTIEVTAEGMTVGTRTYVSANSVTFKEIQAGSTDRKQINVTWSYEGTAPKDGWLLLYTVDGGQPQVIQCDSAATSAVISPLLPGSHYSITIQPTGGGTVYGGTYEFDTSVAPLFSGYWVTSEHMVFRMCRRPAAENWDQSHLRPEDYTTVFHPGEKAAFVINLNHEYTTSNDKIDILFVVRNAEGVPVSFQTLTRTWTYMWYQGIGIQDIPAMPEAPGNYTVEVYYNGASAASQSFTIAG